MSNSSVDTLDEIIAVAELAREQAAVGDYAKALSMLRYGDFPGLALEVFGRLRREQEMKHNSWLENNG